MSNTDIVNRLGATRALIEAAARGPSVLVITSALVTDGASVLSQALAQSLGSAGYSVLLVRSATETTKRPTQNEISRAHDDDDALCLIGKVAGTDGFAVGSIAPTAVYSLDAARNAFRSYRETYQFTVVEAPGALSRGSALSFGRAADFVLVSFEAGRSARDEDRELAKGLSSTGSAVLGVVTLDRKTIRNFIALTKPDTALGRSRSVVPEDALKRSSTLSSSTV